MKGQVFPSEIVERRDVVTDVPVRQLTSHNAHSYHLYFTNPGWYDGNRRLLFGSERLNSSNLYSLELATGIITQLTDSQAESSYMGTCLNPLRDEAYFWRGRELVAIHLGTLAERALCRCPDGFDPSIVTCTADGQYLCTSAHEDVLASRGIQIARGRGYQGYREYFQTRPYARLIEVRIATGEMRVLLEEQAWIGHVNTSPAQPNLLTFCHEGPWHEVKQRIWAADRNTGKVWKVRPQAPGEAVGHEYWMEDGVRIGYHGHAGGSLMYGAIRYDNSERVEAPFPSDSRHFHSLTLDLIVGDGRPKFPYVLLWRFRNGRFEEPRVLCWHRCSWHVQSTHVHPRLTPDGKSVLYTSDDSGYGNLYLADLPGDLEELPTLSELEKSPKRPWVPFEWVP